ncbi:MAG: hypothetical protein GPJ54_18950 [Candidatus Heimdallarchaeota archaeon]|nr:hypothetical protein [Candidatus Heimdallarchaeota archaeon]
MSAGSLKDVLDRLFSIDANDRVKAANEIGEIGTEEEAPIILKVAYEDEASTVQQMAIQSYFEIMKEHGFEEIKKAALSHPDQYVRIYAINILGKIKSELVTDLLLDLLDNNDEKIRATVVKSMIHANTIQNAKRLAELIETENHVLTLCNMIEACTIWKYSEAVPKIKEVYENLSKYNDSIEIKTITIFALAAFNDKKALTQLKEESIDEYYRVKINNKHFKGKSGLLQALEELKTL